MGRSGPPAFSLTPVPSNPLTPGGLEESVLNQQEVSSGSVLDQQGVGGSSVMDQQGGQ